LIANSPQPIFASGHGQLRLLTHQPTPGSTAAAAALVRLQLQPCFDNICNEQRWFPLHQELSIKTGSLWMLLNS
jgi:hypothetical protein